MRKTVAVVVVAAVGLGAWAGAADGRAARGALHIREQATENGRFYVEGAYQYVSVRHVRTKRLVLRKRSAVGLKANVTLAPGYYRIRSWTRTCSGNCDYLDQPSYACRRDVRVRVDRVLNATIHTAVSERCRITADD